jgi:hypothetical protein
MATNVVCPNCSTHNDTTDGWCPSCGQKQGPLKVALFTLLREFIEVVFMVDNRLWSTLRGMWRPGYLTRQWSSGRRQAFISPARFFLVAMLIHLAFIRFTMTLDFVEKDTELLQMREMEALQKSIHWWETKCATDPLLNISPALCDSARITLEAAWALRAQDTVLALHIPFIFEQEIHLLERDLIGVPIDTLAQRHGLSRMREKLVLNQIVRSVRHPEKFWLFLIGNLSWMILLLVPALALFMRLLYVRQPHYFVEHLIFNMHFHAFAFINVSLGMLLDKIVGTSFTPLFMMSTIIYLFLAMHKYYGQGYIKTLLKMILFGFSYFFIALACFITMLIVSFLLFN